MNTLKLQQDIIKTAYDREFKHKHDNLLFCTADRFVNVVTGYAIYRVHELEFFLDPEKCSGRPEGMSLRSFNGIMNREEDSTPATDTHSIVVYTHGKKIEKLHKFILSDGSPIYINDKLLKYFDLSVCTFKGTTPYNLLFVYEHDFLVGAVLPVRYEE